MFVDVPCPISPSPCRLRESAGGWDGVAFLGPAPEHLRQPLALRRPQARADNPLLSPEKEKEKEKGTGTVYWKRSPSPFLSCI
jgi:hypothetical protein